MKKTNCTLVFIYKKKKTDCSSHLHKYITVSVPKLQKKKDNVLVLELVFLGHIRQFVFPFTFTMLLSCHVFRHITPLPKSFLIFGNINKKNNIYTIYNNLGLVINFSFLAFHLPISLPTLLPFLTLILPHNSSIYRYCYSNSSSPYFNSSSPPSSFL